jgi:hypothetical protein
MLEPHGRSLLFEILRPPPDTTLDAAVATTFTMDLLALLTAPVAFTLFDTDSHENLLNRESLTLLESLRRYADKLTVFCHGGRISLPQAQFPQFEFLEKCVVECEPKARDAAFHSKIWLLRFLKSDGGVIYRLACLTRNLTFDRSWDTALTLEGQLLDRQNAVALNHPLGDFIRSMPACATRPVDDAVRQRIAIFESEVRRVQFEVPDGFESYAFHPFGIGGAGRFPFKDRPGRMMIISPFVSSGGLQMLNDGRQGTLLVSRPDSLEQPGCDFHGMERIYVLSQGTEDEDFSGPENESDVNVGRGLHAKCYLIDAGWKTHVFTGSANATEAAFRRNVEFLVELVGPKSKFGIEALFRREEGTTSFADLLDEFDPKAKPLDEKEAGLRAAIERAREILIAARFTASISSASDDQFTLCVTPTTLVAGYGDGVEVRCWPVTLGKGWAVDMPVGDAGASFQGLSLEALTAFIAFEIAVGEPARSEVFVLNLPLQGAPTDRRERLLRSFLKDRNRFLRFLFFLLADDAELADAVGAAHAHSALSGEETASMATAAVLESLLRTLHRSPGRLDSVARLIEDLRQRADTRDLMPPRLEEIWEPIWAARRQIPQ